MLPRFLPQRGAKEKRPAPHRLAFSLCPPDLARMWSQTYLETCCRSALHRLQLAGEIGRPDGLKDGPCLHRMAALNLTSQREDGRFVLTKTGQTRHAAEVLGGLAPTKFLSE